MAEKFRDPETYRWARRNRWCELKAHYGVSWAEFNQPQARDGATGTQNARAHA